MARMIHLVVSNRGRTMCGRRAGRSWCADVSTPDNGGRIYDLTGLSPPFLVADLAPICDVCVRAQEARGGYVLACALKVEAERLERGLGE